MNRFASTRSEYRASQSSPGRAQWSVGSIDEDGIRYGLTTHALIASTIAIAPTMVTIQSIVIRQPRGRLRVACEIGRLKKAQGVEVYQPDREKDVLRHVREVASEGPLGPDAIVRLFERIIDEARRLERRVVHGENGT